MLRPYLTLAEYPMGMVRLACTKCDPRGQYRKATLIERYGPDANMVDLRLKLAAGCPKSLPIQLWTCAACTIPTASGDEKAPLWGGASAFETTQAWPLESRPP
jgi:hypothetical protein